MQHSINLSEINFGRDDATLEANGLLAKVFLKTSVYNRVKNGGKLLVTGRKGSGKSAICFYLIDALKAEGREAIRVTTGDLSRTRIQQLRATAIDDKESFESAWRYVFLVKIAIRLIELIDQGEFDEIYSEHENIKQLRGIRDFLSQNDEIDKNIAQKLGSFLNRFSKFGVKVPGGLETTAEARQVESIRDLSAALDKFQNCILRLIRIAKGFKITILVDEVDDIWNSTEESKHLITGLLDAITKVNGNLNPSALVIVFLRSDIWDSLEFFNKDKFRSVDERINWSKEDLKRLITNRGKIAANLADDFDTESVWKLLFEKKVGEQHSFDYIIDRTLKRPREVIQYCNLALSFAQDANRSRITEEDILAAEARYSIWKLDDLINEFSVQYPFLRDTFNVFDGFQSSFTKEQIAPRFEKSKAMLSQKFNELSGLDLDDFLQLLFGIGFLGAKVLGEIFYLHDQLDYKRIVLPYIVDLEAIVIHPAFRLALGLNPPSSQDSRKYNNYGRDHININQIGNINTGNIRIGGDAGGNIIRDDRNES
ncbi:P-loop ATPase, Sll1717 family [Leptolyngbya sp. AN10]|uniref:P-loop ATPase, Sll1717 family n=1 Tax=Leptolyngbya sp. AN10 TaxID=3423365 RepID=UPI003D317076